MEHGFAHYYLISLAILLGIALPAIYGINRYFNWLDAKRKGLLNGGLYQAKLDRAKSLALEGFVKLNSLAYPSPTFSRRDSIIAVWTPMGCYIGKMNMDNYYALAIAGYYQINADLPMCQKHVPRITIPFDPETGLQITDEALSRWQQLERKYIEDKKSWADEESLEKLEPIFRSNQDFQNFTIH